MKKTLLFIGLIGFSVQAMDVDQGKLIKFKTSDDQIILLSREVAGQSGTLAELLKDAEKDSSYNSQESLPIGSDITSAELRQITPFLELLTESQNDETLEKLKEKYDSLEINDDEMFRFAKNIRYLDIEKVLQILPVPVETNDEKIFWVEPNIVAQSSVLTHWLDQFDGDKSESIILQNVDAESFQNILNVLQNISKKLGSQQTIDIHTVSNYLGIEKLQNQIHPLDFFLSKKFNSVKHLKVSPDGQYCALMSLNCWRLVRTADWSKIKSFSPVDDNYNLCFSPNSKYCAFLCKAIGFDHGKLINTANGSVIKSFKEVCYFKFSPNNHSCGVKHSKNGEWDLIYTANGKVIKHLDGVNYFEFSPNGQFCMLECSGNKGQLLNTTNGSILKSFENIEPGPIHYSFFSPDSNYLAMIFSNNTGQLLQTSDCLMVKSFDKVEGFGFSPDCGYVLVCSNDKKGGQLICTADWSIIKNFDNWIWGFSFSPDCHFCGIVHSGETGSAQIINTLDGSVIKSFNNVNANFQFSPNSRYCAIKYRNGTVDLVNTIDWSTIKNFDSIWHLVFSQDSNYCIMRKVAGDVRLIRIVDGAEIEKVTNLKGGHRSWSLSAASKFLTFTHKESIGELIKLYTLSDHLPDQNNLLMRVYNATQKNKKITLTKDEYKAYKLLDKHEKAKIKKHIILPKTLYWLRKYAKFKAGN